MKIILTSDFAEFDLHVEFRTRANGDSGISIRDSSRAKYGIVSPPGYKRTQSKIGYEIQINNRYPDPHPPGSIYGFADAKPGAMRENDWNALDVRLNRKLVAEHAGDPARPKARPIGLQLHDRFSVLMFRNIRIRELPGKARPDQSCPAAFNSAPNVASDMTSVSGWLLNATAP